MHDGRQARRGTALRVARARELLNVNQNRSWGITCLPDQLRTARQRDEQAMTTSPLPYVILVLISVSRRQLRLTSCRSKYILDPKYRRVPELIAGATKTLNPLSRVMRSGTTLRDTP